VNMHADDELRALFFEEGRENLELLQESLLELERDANSQRAIQEAFRAAHSMKGMAGAMGCNGLMALLHAMEDVLGEVREGDRVLDETMTELLLRSVDQAISSLADMDAGTTQDADAVSLIEALHQCMALPTAESDRAPADFIASGGAGPTDELVAAVMDAGQEVIRVELQPDPRSMMPAVRAYAAVMQLQDLGEILHTSPPMSELEEGALLDGAVVAWVATQYTAEQIAEEMATCIEITGISTRSWVPATLTTLASPLEVHSNTPARTRPDTLGSRSRTVRVDSDRLDALMHSVGELLVRRAHVESVARRFADHDLRDALDELARAARDMQSMVMDVRMVSIDIVFRRLPRLVRDLASSLGKDVELVCTGGDTELDRTVIDLLGDPLVHLVRNAIDHGIELPDARRARGKSARGTLRVSATATGGVVLLRVQDDGGGINPDAIRRTALERGVASSAELDSMAPDQLLQLCFAPGFSTRSEVSDISGRGVGLDVVRSSVRALGGDVAVASDSSGTTMTIKLPLTLAIVPVLLVMCSSHTYALPLNRVQTIIDGSSEAVCSVGGRTSVDLGDRVIGVTDLGELLRDVSRNATSGHIVLVDGGTDTMAIRVDHVVSQAEVVTRPIPNVVDSSPFVSASATLGDGEIAMLIDTEAIAHAVTRDLATHVPVSSGAGIADTPARKDA
jgi:two-component system chemotaxis sensor kinase CheA